MERNLFVPAPTSPNVSPRTTPNFCSQCGASLSPGDAFCSQCGVAVDESAAAGTATARTDTSTASAVAETANEVVETFTSGRSTAGSETAGSTPELRRRVEDFALDGWDVERDDGDRVVMVDRGIGSPWIHALLFAATTPLGNLLYAWYSYSPGAQRVELRADGTERRPDDGRSTGWTPASAVGVAAGLMFAAFLALVGLVVLAVSSSLIPMAIGLALWLTAVVAVPLATQFAPGFESPLTFGRRHETDERVVDAPDTPCSACARPVGTGVERRFAEKAYVAGIPVRTYDEGENVYCRACANGDPFVGESVEDGETDRDWSREYA